MSAPTVTLTATARVSTVRFADVDDARAFLERVAERGDRAKTGVTFPIFAATAADAYGVRSALTYAMFSEVDCADLPDGATDASSETPTLVGPVATTAGWEIVQILSISP